MIFVNVKVVGAQRACCVARLRLIPFPNPQAVWNGQQRVQELTASSSTVRSDIMHAGTMEGGSAIIALGDGG